MTESTTWVKDLLNAAESNPTQDAISLIENCGRACSRRKGHAQGMEKLREAASWCKSKADYVKFLKENMLETVTEEEDGIRIPLGKTGCTCPMAKDIRSPMLCCCTQGSNKETWSIFFGRDVRVEMVETFMRGGNDCVIKIYM